MKYTFIALAVVAFSCLAFVMNSGIGANKSEKPKTTKDCCIDNKNKTTECTEAQKKSCCSEASTKGEGGGEAVGEVEFFSGSWKELLAKAEKDKKPIWVDVYTDWCGPCKMMAKTTFKDEEIATQSKKTFLAYKIDAEKGEGIKIASDYNVNGYPTILYFGADGKLLGREVGVQDAEKFSYNMDKYLKKAGKSKGKKK